VSSQGSAYARFRRSLETRNPLDVLAAARELPRLSLADALGVCVVFALGHSELFSRAAARWIGRYAIETGCDLTTLRSAADALAYAGETRDLEPLHQALDRHMPRLAAVVERFEV
jgi:hypothetical protein